MIHDPEFVSLVRTRRRIFVALFAAAACASVAIAFYSVRRSGPTAPPLQPYKDILGLYERTTITTASGTHELYLEPADTPDKRSQGLMFRRTLAKNSGMLFVFDRDTSSPFWMKNTRIPLDILFVSADMHVVDFLTMEPCADGEECTLYLSSKPYRFAIEVNKGFAEEHEVGMGDLVALKRQAKQ